MVISGGDKDDTKAQLRESILDSCKTTITWTSTIDVNCLLVIRLDKQELLPLNIQERISPYKEEKCPKIEKSEDGNGTQTHHLPGKKMVISGEDKKNTKAQLRESILDSCKRTCTSAIYVNCLLVVGLANQELLLNIRERISPHTEEKCRKIKKRKDRNGTQTHHLPFKKSKQERTLKIETKFITDGSIDSSAIDDESTAEYKGQRPARRKRIYHPREQHQCPVCNVVINRKDNLNRHMKKHKDQMVKCNLCPKEFYSKGVLEEHIEVEHKNNLYHCNRCGKMFKHKQHLKEHIAAHEGDFKFKCSDCNRKYFSKVAFEYHRKTHEGTRDFTCSKCGKTFITKGHVKGHEEKCSLDKETNRCKQCYKKIITTASYRQHLKYCTLNENDKNSTEIEGVKRMEDLSSEEEKSKETEETDTAHHDIPTNTEVELTTGGIATIAVRNVPKRAMATKVDSLASSKIGQSFKKSVHWKSKVSEDSDENSRLHETTSSQDEMEVYDELPDVQLHGILVNEAMSPNSSISSTFDLELPSDEHEHNDTSVSDHTPPASPPQL